MHKVLMIEDDSDLAEVLTEYLGEMPDIEIVSVIGNLKDAVDWINKNDLNQLHCALVDLSIPDSRGSKQTNSLAGLSIIELLRKEKHFTGKVMVLTNSRAIEDGQRALAAGCDGYLCKHGPMSEIPTMIDELVMAIKGDVMMVSKGMRHVFLRETLSAKEAQLMDLVAEGFSWAEIATKLDYKSSNAAAVVGFRIFDKLIPAGLQTGDSKATKRELALERWLARKSTN